ncbi:2-C-methyl-D-erythritol 2,4-cyclodiphosphate synthase [Haematococcus lacustris]|uniref:2-C-methyl-D-erythritol 2,4-cyclodiphosphate synthase n=1 Tax=Haematococcus lacustris TaxID=44745 RepID=A0A699YIY7_HAELA|nr:2-C-methyl-D-erythritol 2,4-cyclodiphosphate synthase [Haematococcus lacustris]
MGAQWMYPELPMRTCLANSVITRHPAEMMLQCHTLRAPCQGSFAPALRIPQRASRLARHQRPVRAQAAAVTAPVLPFRVGHGFDLHRLAEGYKLVIGGIEIPHTKGCEAHSDGDVLLHTITDAILGALCLPDIGQLFPDTDPKWKGARSDIFLNESVRLMEERGYTLGNIDCTIIAQKPKLSPHKETIRHNLCRLLKADESVAKTHERVDSIGEERSIACHAVVMLLRKE